jgi:hypothetical protein
VIRVTQYQLRIYVHILWTYIFVIQSENSHGNNVKPRHNCSSILLAKILNKVITMFVHDFVFLALFGK